MTTFQIYRKDYLALEVEQWLLENADKQYSILSHHPDSYGPSARPFIVVNVNCFNEDLALRFKLSFSEYLVQLLD